jgi:small-conductance mechanosensitive channel
MKAMSSHVKSIIFGLTLVVGLALCGWCGAETALVKKPLAIWVKEWNLVLERVDKNLARPDLPDGRLAELRQELLALRIDMAAEVAAAAPEVQVVRDELQTLGPPPAEGAPAESPAVASKRKAISEQLASAEGAMKESELILGRANRLIADISTRQRERYTDRILTRGPSPLFPSVWKKVGPELREDVELARQDIQYWVQSDQFAQQGRSMGRNLTIGVVAAFILVWPLRLWLLRRFGYVTVEHELTHGHRLQVALFTGFIRILMPTAATVAVYLAMKSSGLLPDQAQVLADTTLQALVFLYVVAAFCHAALAPFGPEWRLVAIGDEAARTVSRVVTAIAVVFAFDQVIDQLRDLFEASLELTLVHKFLSGLAISGLLLILLQPPIWAAGADGCEDPSRPWRRLRLFMRVLVLGIPSSAILGYVALSRVLATQLVLTAGLYVAFSVIRQVGIDAVEQSLSRQSLLGQRVRNALNLSDDGAEILRFWISETLSVLVFVAAVLALMVLWGAGGDDLTAWLHTAFFGFRVGSITISLADILMALLLFAAFLAVTRVLQHWLDHRIFPRTRLDLGIRHSVRSATGYVGFTLATVVAVSTVGIDLSNLAMIAGALSVGIGFGLQNIVNNFVSGLILLIERPIKVGDWVVIGDHQGYVKKISVRATEISTFDRASVFIPNSSLISGPVMNRTYADKVGRAVLGLALPHGTDSKKVKDLVLAIAEGHADVLRNPAPTIVHKGYVDSLLQMELTAFIRDVDKVKAVSSDLWFDIEDCFRREGIAIPSSQKDFRVVLQDDQLAKLTEALSGAVAGPSGPPGVKRQESRI